MSLCNRWGIPLSLFLGGPVPKPGEPLWLESDRDFAVEFEAYQRGVCRSCGTRDEEWRDPETKREKDPPPYVAEPIRCAGCVAVADATKEVRRSLHGDAAGVAVFLRAWDPKRDELDEDEG